MVKIKKETDNFFYKNNRLQQIRGFYYSVRFKSISKAANKIGLTQSSITLQIQSLERDLDVVLLDRNNKNSFLTKEGKKFYEMICPLVQEFESIIQNFQENVTQEQENTIKIAVHHVAISYLMPKIIAKFKKIYPETKLILQNISPMDAISRLKNEEIDFAFFPNLPLNPEIQIINTKSYKPILVMNKKNPLVNLKVETLKDLQKYDLIRIDPNLITLPLFEEAFHTYNLKGSIEFENGNWEMLKSLVEENNFVALLSMVCINEDDKDFHIVDLSKFFPEMTYGIAVKNKTIKSKKIKKLIEIIKDNV